MKLVTSQKTLPLELIEWFLIPTDGLANNQVIYIVDQNQTEEDMLSAFREFIFANLKNDVTIFTYSEIILNEFRILVKEKVILDPENHLVVIHGINISTYKIGISGRFVNDAYPNCIFSCYTNQLYRLL